MCSCYQSFLQFFKNKYTITTMKKAKSTKKIQNSQVMCLASLLSSLELKRKSYSMQLLKQFILFPDESDSSQKTVSKYDSLIFSDEHLHTMFKKLQTKLIASKIWAFLNLKYHRYRQAIHLMQKPVASLQQRIQQQHKAYTFIQIKTYSEIKTQNARVQTDTNTTIQTKMPNTPKKNVATTTTTSKKDIQSPRKAEGTGNKIEINIDITHRTSCNHQETNYNYQRAKPANNYQSPSRITQTSSQVRSRSRIDSESQLYPAPSVNYPISQLHPMQPRDTSNDKQRQNRHAGNYSQAGQGGREGRSRSGSITKYQLDIDGARKRVINGKEVPVYIKLVKNQRTPQQPQYTIVYEPSRIEETKPSTLSRAELQKRQNLRYQYQQQNTYYKGNSRVQRITPSKVYGRPLQNSQNSVTCPHCCQKHNVSSPCPNQRSGKKIIRLRSTSKKDIQNGYMQHLHS